MRRTDLEGAISRQSWEWLADLAPRLDIIVELLDAEGAPVIPAGASQDAASFRTLLTGGEATIHAAVSDVRGPNNRVFISVESFQALCCGLPTGSALLLARKLTGAESVGECREDLESIGNWLTGAIEESLTQASSISLEPYRILSFRRILREAASRGSIRRVIGAFVEALSVWDNVRVRCYISGADGGLVEAGAPLESPPVADGAPDEAVLPRHGRLIRLSPVDAARFGLVAEPGDTVISRMLVNDIPWLLVFSGKIDDREQVRLRLYSDILRESLSNVVMVTTSRLVAEVSRSTRSTNEPRESQAQAVLEQLTNAMNSQRGALALTTASGRHALAVGHSDLLSPEEDRPDRMTVKSSEAGSVLTVAFERERPLFTAFDRELALAGVAVVHRWMQPAEQSTDVERRRRARAVDAVFDQLATAAIATGRHASVIVVALDKAGLRPGILPAWVGRIRAQLRAGDYAGLLSESEIAVLLCGASAAHASVVSARLMQIFRSDDSGGAFFHPAIGMTTRVPDSPFEGSIVGAARTLASARQ